MLESVGRMFRQLIRRISTLDNPPPWGWLIGLWTVIVAFAAVLIGTTLVLLVFSDVQYSALASWTIGAIIAIAFVFIRFRKPEERAALRLGGAERGNAAPFQQLFLMLLIGVGLSVALDVVIGRVTSTFLPEPELLRLYTDATLLRLPVSPLSWGFVIVFMVILQPVSEELIFRGVLLPSLRTTIGAWTGYLVSALLYAVFHLITFTPSPDNPNSLWFGLVAPFIGGLIFGAIRLYTGSTRAASLAHVGFGMFAVVKLITLL